uniref:PH domain-containing protein n=1 Tax=Oryza meridionalis TaxID=40149 RepID=A0A0E0CZX0_9ORYZ
MFGFGHHGHHGQDQPPQHHGGGAHQPTFKIFCRADEGYCVAVREGNVVLAPTNPRDEHQHWYKDMRFSAKIKDEEGNPAFALVNKATGLAIKHSLGQGHPVKLAPFNPEYPDESVLWTESGDVGKSFRCIRMLNNIRLNFDAFHGDKDHGGVHDGTTIVLWEWAKGDNQCWKILPWGDEAYAGGSANAPRGGNEPTVRIFCKADEGFSVTVRGGSVCLAPTNPRDEYQHWIKDMRHSNSIKDEEGYPAFALVNRVTGEAIKHSQGEGHPVKLVPYNPGYQDESVLWTESRDVGHGFRCIRMVNNIYLNFDALHGDKDHGGVRDGTTVALWKWCEGDNQRWKIVPWCKLPHPNIARCNLFTSTIINFLDEE